MKIKNLSIQFFSLILILLAFTSCEDITEKVLPRPSAKAGDLLVVIDTAYWNHKSGEVIRNTFAKEQNGLPQREAKFDLINLQHQSFAQIFRTNRNILIVDINPKSKIKLSVKEEVWSETQIVITISAPSDEIAAETIEKNSEALVAYFDNKEIERLQQKYRVNRDSDNAKLLEKEYGINIHVDDLFVVAKKDEDFIWMRKEKWVGENPVSQGVLVYTYPYDNDSIFDVNQLINKRNYFTKKHVQGSHEKSYMVTYEDYVPYERELNLKNIYVKEVRSLWEVKNDFMGGAFVSFSMVDEKKNRLICVDCYVYAPKFDKREYLRELEAMALTITF